LQCRNEKSFADKLQVKFSTTP